MNWDWTKSTIISTPHAKHVNISIQPKTKVSSHNMRLIKIIQYVKIKRCFYVHKCVFIWCITVHRENNYSRTELVRECGANGRPNTKRKNKIANQLCDRLAVLACERPACSFVCVCVCQQINLIFCLNTISFCLCVCAIYSRVALCFHSPLATIYRLKCIRESDD